MKNFLTVFIIAATVCAVGARAETVRDIAYDSSLGNAGIGDLYLPGKVTADTPAVLAIHGGGWSSSDRESWRGVAEFFCNSLDCAVFNIEYRLAGKANRWPACGDDCVKAANWMFSEEFASRAGFRPKKIFICGGSAGGHLALWTLVNLPPERVAGVVSISSIGDPVTDFHMRNKRYHSLFGPAVNESDLSVMNPIRLIRPGMAPVLCTHATDDKVVPIASHRAFAAAYKAAGNFCEFFEYPNDVQVGLTGHCIWIPGSKPHKLISALEDRISGFIKKASDCIWADFVSPPDAVKPWCYWWWINGHVDRETISADLEAMKKLGFGGVLMFDSRGYWDDGEHVINPKAELQWGSEEWFDLVEFSIRECARLGLRFTMNASASGGWLNGFIDGREYQVDVMNRSEIIAHLDRIVGVLLKRVPEAVGKTFTHVYSVSYEGKIRKGATWRDIKDVFYGTIAKWAHEHGLGLYSESGGPWGKSMASSLSEGEQLEFLAHNDIPQGEFWPLCEKTYCNAAGHANRSNTGRYFQRAPVLAARRNGKRIVSMEAFTHMLRHWSVDPAVLKPTADIAYADGANHLVWHTFTCSPRKFGVPGLEYFAGTHINRNVTWHTEAEAFVGYLGRCQALLQRGEPVDDGEFLNVRTNYFGWGRYRRENTQFTTAHRREGSIDWFFVIGEGKGTVKLKAAFTGRTVEIWDPVAVTRRTVKAVRHESGYTCVPLELPVGGSCFVVFIPGAGAAEPFGCDSEIIGVPGPWRVAFAYPDGIDATPPPDMIMTNLIDFTSTGERGKADSRQLRYFSGTAKYFTELTLSANQAKRAEMVSLGEISSGLARVAVNGIDCGTVWCAPWKAYGAGAFREGVNKIEICYINNWSNRLTGDCFLPESERVTRSSLRYWTVPRRKSDPSRPWLQIPTVYSGPSVSDKLQASGILGPVNIELRK